MKYLKFETIFIQYVFEDKFDFKNQSRKPVLLAAPLIASNEINFAIKRAVAISSNK